MEAELSKLLHLVGCWSPASRCSVTLNFSTFVRFPTVKNALEAPDRTTLCLQRLRMPSEARPQPLPTAELQGSPRRTSSSHRHTPRFQWALGSCTPRGCCVSLFTRRAEKAAEI